MSDELFTCEKCELPPDFCKCKVVEAVTHDEATRIEAPDAWAGHREPPLDKPTTLGDIWVGTTGPKRFESWEKLTAREREVLITIASGENPHDWCKRVGISIKTFDSHRTKALRKLDISLDGITANVRVTRLLIREGIVSAS